MDSSDEPGSSKSDQKKKKAKKNEESSETPLPISSHADNKIKTNLNKEDATQTHKVNKSIFSINKSQETVSTKSQTNKKKQKIAPKSDEANWRNQATSSSQNSTNSKDQQNNSQRGSTNQNYQESQPSSSKSQNYKNQDTIIAEKSMDPSDIPGSSKTDQKKKQTRRGKGKSKKKGEAFETMLPNSSGIDNSGETNLNNDATQIQKANKSAVNNLQQSDSSKIQTNKEKKQNNAKKSDTCHKQSPSQNSKNSNGQYKNSQSCSANQNYQHSQPSSSKSKNYKNKNNSKKANSKWKRGKPTTISDDRSEDENWQYDSFEQIHFGTDPSGFVSYKQHFNPFDPVYVGIDTTGSISFLFTDSMDIESASFKKLPLDSQGIMEMYRQFKIQFDHRILCTTIGVNSSHNNEMLKLFVEYGNHCKFNNVHLITYPTIALFAITYQQEIGLKGNF